MRILVSVEKMKTLFKKKKSSESKFQDVSLNSENPWKSKSGDSIPTHNNFQLEHSNKQQQQPVRSNSPVKNVPISRIDSISTLYEKAQNSMSLVDIFELFDLIIEEENKTRKYETTFHSPSSQQIPQINQLQNKKEFLYKRVQKFLSLILQYRKTHPSRSYTFIFHEHMKTILSTNQKDIFHYNNNSSYATINNYIQTLSFYLSNKDSQFASSNHSSVAIEILDEYYEEAHLLLNFLEEHKVDAYSSLIGLSPSRDLLKCTLDDVNKKDIGYYYDIIPPRDLYESIIYWANSAESPEEIISQIKFCSTLLRGVNHLKKGDLVIFSPSDDDHLGDHFEDLDLDLYNSSHHINVSDDNNNINDQNIINTDHDQNNIIDDQDNNKNNNKEENNKNDQNNKNKKKLKKRYKIGRYSGISRNDKQTMEIYLSLSSDSKKEATTINMENIYPIPFYITKNLIDDHFFSFQKYVENSFDLFQSKMIDYFKFQFRNYLEKEKIDYSLLYKAMSNQCSILDLPDIKRNFELINLLNISDDYFLSLENEYQKKKNLFISNEISVFYPIKEKSLENIKTIPIKQLINKEINKYRGSLEFSLDQIEIQRRELINGDRKRKLVEWWHNLIHDSVKKFLISLDYSMSAVGNEYTSVPPTDMRKVTNNYKILRDILDGRHFYHFNELIEKLKLDIYKKIDSFVLDASLSILEFLGLGCTLKDIQNFNSKDILLHVDNSFSPSASELKGKREWVRELVKDLEYLETMKKLENPFCSDEEKRKNFHIVPISGLAKGIIFRMENETKTTIELWSSFDYMKNSFKDDRFKLHHLILNENFNSVELFIENNVNINEPDVNGWSPLHLASSSSSYFPICKKLIEYGAKVNVINEHGNIPLHYLAKCRLDPNLESTDHLLQLDILKQMIEHGVNLDFKNSDGETPLHFACLVGNFEFVRLLVCNLCSVLSLNNSNETCLHYAIQSNNNDLVKFLLEHGADSKIKDKRGRTPLDLALQFNSSEIVSTINSFSTPSGRGRKSTIYSRNNYKSSSHISYNNNSNNNNNT